AAPHIEDLRTPGLAVQHGDEGRLRTADVPGRPAHVGGVAVDPVVVVVLVPGGAAVGVACGHLTPPDVQPAAMAPDRNGPDRRVDTGPAYVADAHAVPDQAGHHRRPCVTAGPPPPAGGAGHTHAPPSRIVTRHHDRPGATMSLFRRWRRG